MDDDNEAREKILHVRSTTHFKITEREIIVKQPTSIRKTIHV